MKRLPKCLVALAATALFLSALFLSTGAAFAQAFPAKPIRFIMPYPPGGSSEILARPIALEMSKNLGGPAITALLGREVDLIFDSLSSSLAQIQGGKFRAIAVSTAKRSHVLPQVPTIQESGVPGFDISAWYGIFAPAATPPAVVQKLNAEIVKAMNAREAKERIEASGYQIVGSTPAQLDAHVKSEITRWAKVVKESGAKLE